MTDKYKETVYRFLFYVNKQWDFDGPTQYFEGHSIHYSDFMKAKRGTL